MVPKAIAAANASFMILIPVTPNDSPPEGATNASEKMSSAAGADYDAHSIDVLEGLGRRSGRFRPIADIQRECHAPTVRGIASALALALLAGGGGREQSEPGYAKINMVLVIPSPLPAPTPVARQSCEMPTYDSVGNRWWAGFTACEGDVLVDVEADSVNLGGPAVRITIHTPSCPAGQGAGGESFDRAIFDRPYEAQLAEIKRIVRQSLARIDEACGGAAHAPRLLGRQFDEEFRDLAGRWLGLSAADRRRSWGS